ncbi:hypothetical protein [Chamaesiphon sp. OTE_8_metabat_110]|uniref:hypothetical protein n=1 Tax=Chamaesiphon sp. OTE_8_metabat_110 TaxID=2964696 RepID=UPI00286CCA06|nr:hypothetical protein [Chamaesiphon sp. OTE_8_metabat_110]
MNIALVIFVSLPPLDRDGLKKDIVTPPHHKIHLDQEYPCPCHLHGKLQHIVLTEAFGCDRCHRLFVLQADGLTVEELAATYPYKRRYYWNGKRLKVLRSLPKDSFWASRHESWAIWMQTLGAIGLVLLLLQLYCRAILTSPLLNLVISIAIAIIVLIVITLWLFDQG